MLGPGHGGPYLSGWTGGRTAPDRADTLVHVHRGHDDVFGVASWSRGATPDGTAGNEKTPRGQWPRGVKLGIGRSVSTDG